MLKKRVSSVEEMNGVAAEVAARLRGGEVLALSGELGAGKTTLVQGLAKALGVEQPVASPTFVLQRQYLTDRGFTLYHYDWYRLDSVEQVRELGLDDVWGRSDVVVVVEWPERAWELLPEQTRIIRLEYVDEHTRQLSDNN